MKRMNIVYICYSCSPIYGSEDAVGWYTPKLMSKNHNVFVITKEEHREDINRYIKDNPNEKYPRFIYCDIPNIYKKIYRGPAYSMRLLIWQKKAYNVVRNIVQHEKIDIIHQLTPVEFRAIGKYGDFNAIKYIVGPIGGAESIPNQLRYYARRNILTEIIRKLVNKVIIKNKTFKKNLKNIDVILFANNETKNYIESEVGNTNGLIMTEIGHNYNQSHFITIKENQKIQFLYAGRLIYRKGIEFLLDALSKLDKDLEYEVLICGDGKERKFIENKIKTLGLQNKVTLLGKVNFSEMKDIYKKADILLFPSIRETTGSVILESLSNGIPVMALNKFGAKIILDNNCSWLIDLKLTREECIEEISKTIQEGIVDKKILKYKKMEAMKKVRFYSWEEKSKNIEKIYDKVISR